MTWRSTNNTSWQTSMWKCIEKGNYATDSPQQRWEWGSYPQRDEAVGQSPSLLHHLQCRWRSLLPSRIVPHWGQLQGVQSPCRIHLLYVSVLLNQWHKYKPTITHKTYQIKLNQYVYSHKVICSFFYNSLALFIGSKKSFSSFENSFSDISTA